MTIISSSSNPKIKQVRALQQRKARLKTGLFVVEGIRPVGEACAAQAEIEYLFYAPNLLTSSFAHQLIEEQSGRGIPCYSVNSDLFASLAEKENPQGLLAVVRQHWSVLADLHPGNFSWGVALVSPQDPGNIGAVLRSIDAVGASGLLLLEDSADPYHPSSVRASMGAIFWYPLVKASFIEFAQWAMSLGYTIYGTSAHGNSPYEEQLVYKQPLILLMGSEREGLTSEQINTCHTLLRMPMRGRVTSLNLAVATGIMLYAILAKQNPSTLS
jgi:TrmH family RNA methyltransferase